MFSRWKKVLQPQGPAPVLVASGERELAGRTAGVDAEALAVQHPRLFAQWENGDLRPGAITLAFDPHAQAGRGLLYATNQFIGSWVDEACGTAEPVVEGWEEGFFYPSWEQLCKLAALTETPLHTLLNSTSATNLFNGCVQVATAFALRQSFHPLIVFSSVSAHPKAPELADMILALEHAIVAIEKTIDEGTDPLTLFLHQQPGAQR